MARFSKTHWLELGQALLKFEGPGALTLERLTESAGKTRGSFYHHFKSKDDILDAVITRRLAATRLMLDAWEADAAPKDRIVSFIRVLIANRTKIIAFGCPVGTLATELAKLDHIAQDRAADIFGLFRDWLARQFRALGRGDDAEPLALHLLGRSQGIAVMALALKDEAFLVSEVAALENWLARLPEPSLVKG